MLFGVAAAGLRAVPVARRGAVVVVLTVLVGVIAVVNLPTADSANGPQSQLWAIPGTRAINAQLPNFDGDAPLLIDGLFLKLFDPYGTAVAAELQRRDIPFVVENGGLVRQFGPERRYDGTNARSELLLETGDAGPGRCPGRATGRALRSALALRAGPPGNVAGHAHYRVRTGPARCG